MRKFNYTGRKRIKREDISVSVTVNDDGRHLFSAGFALDSYELPDDALIVLEPYRQMTRQRIDCGTVGSPLPPVDENLDEFSDAEAVLFSLRIVSPDQPAGILLAGADKIRPKKSDDEDEEKRISLLPVISEELHGPVWRVDLANEEGPLLGLEASLDKNAVVRSPEFRALVLPAALKEILLRILLVDEYFDTEDRGEWRSNWLYFCTRLPGVAAPNADDDPEDIIKWTEDTVTVFARALGVVPDYSHTFAN